jgi:hypothetical protein
MTRIILNALTLLAVIATGATMAGVIMLAMTGDKTTAACVLGAFIIAALATLRAMQAAPIINDDQSDYPSARGY